MKAYKVVRKYRGCLYSAWMMAGDRLRTDGALIPLRKEYQLGKRTKADPQTLGLMAFATPRDARAFARVLGPPQAVIFVGKLERGHKISEALSILALSLPKHEQWPMGLPAGTVAGAAFTPTAVVEEA